MKILENISLKPYNTFGIEAYTRYYARVNNIQELQELLANSDIKTLPRLVLGGGSNILITKDFEGITIHIAIEGIEKIKEIEESVFVKAGAGIVWHQFVLYCIANGYAGVENLSLIPGTVGAAPMQNIGAYGVELKETFYELQALEIETLQLQTFNKTQCAFGYRDSFFKQAGKSRFIITDVTFCLKKHAHLNTSYGAIEQELLKMGVSNPGIADVSRAVCNIRSSKLPNPADIGNAGSFFKNPEIPLEKFNNLKVQYPNIVGYPTANGVKVAAGWLIEQCGYKGIRKGEVGVHAKQALVLVNYGGGKGGEIIALANSIISGVMEKFGIQLEMEVNMI